MSHNKKPDVFISYARSDMQVAEGLETLLKSIKLEVFRDNQVEFGKMWRLVIQDALRAAKTIVVILTPSSVGKPWVWVEAGAAIVSRFKQAGQGTEKRLVGLLIGTEPNDDRLSPIADIQLVAPRPEEITTFLNLLTNGKQKPSKEEVRKFVDLCASHRPAPDPKRPWCQEIGRGPVCEQIRAIGAAVNKANEYLEKTGAFHDLALSEGLLWFGHSQSPEVSDQIIKTLQSLHRADKSWELVLMGNSLKRFFVEILEGRDPRVQKPFLDDFLGAVRAGMRVKVLLRMPPEGVTTATDVAVEHVEKNRDQTVRKQTNLTLRKIAGLKDQIGQNAAGQIEVRLTDGEMHSSLIWLHREGSDDESFMLATHYMRDGLHNYYDSAR